MNNKELMFESSVNSEYSKTKKTAHFGGIVFESSVNSEYSKTDVPAVWTP